MSRRALTSNRRLYLCTYDVQATREGDRRRDKLFERLSDYGEHVQFSVFLCELTPTEHARLLAEAKDILHHAEDQLLVLDVGPSGLDWTQHLACLGKGWTPQVRCHIV